MSEVKDKDYYDNGEYEDDYDYVVEAGINGNISEGVNGNLYGEGVKGNLYGEVCCDLKGSVTGNLLGKLMK